jgi:hypothetical protein
VIFFGAESQSLAEWSLLASAVASDVWSEAHVERVLVVSVGVN